MNSDRMLLQEYAQTRNPDAFAALVQRYAGLVYGVCLRTLGNAHDAEDVAQECFLELARNAKLISQSLPGWLHVTASNRAMDCLRKQARQRVHEEGAADQPKSPNEPSWAEIAPVVDQALQRLPEEVRVPLMLHYFQGRSQIEVAEAVGVNQSTVSRRIADGVEMLRNELKRKGVVASGEGLGGLLLAHAVTQAPQAVTSAAVKIALAGIGTQAAGGVAAASKIPAASAAAGGFFVANKIIVLAVALVAAAGMGWSMQAHNPPAVQAQKVQPPPAAAGALAVPETRDEPRDEKAAPKSDAPKWEDVTDFVLDEAVWRRENGELAATAPKGGYVAAFSKKSWPGESLVLEYDTWIDGENAEGSFFNSGTALVPFANVEECRAQKSGYHSATLNCGRTSDYMWSGIWDDYPPRMFKRNFPVPYNWGEFVAQPRQWYHIRNERIGEFARLYVNGVPICERKLDEPRLSTMYVWIGGNQSDVRFKNIKVMQPDTKYAEEHAKPLKVFGPYHQKLEILSKHEQVLVHDVHQLLGEKKSGQGLAEVPFKGQTGVPEVVAGKACSRTDLVQEKAWGLDFKVEKPEEWNPAHETYLEVEYLERGTGEVQVMYNSWIQSSSPSPTFKRGNSETWVKKLFPLPEAKFHHAGWHFWVGVMRGDDTDLFIHSVRVIEVARPKEAYEEVLKAFDEEIRQHKDDWTVPHYQFRMAEVLYSNLNRKADAEKLMRAMIEKYPNSEAIPLYNQMAKVRGWKTSEALRESSDF